MNAVKCEEYEIMLKKNLSILSDLASSLAQLREKNIIFSSNFSSSNLSFVKDTFNTKFNQFDNISKKTENYQVVLKSVYESYVEQANQIVRDINNLIS